MTIHEPLTMATDYILAVVSFTCAVLLWRRNARAWFLMFLFTAAGSFFGGTYHGLGPSSGAFAAATLWKATVISVGLASFFLLVAAVQHRLATVFALLLFIAYASWMITHSSFLWVVIDYGATFIAVAIVHTTLWIRRGMPASRWIVWAFLVSAVAAAVQQSSIAIGPMRHNDVYHLVQIVALCLLWRGAVLMSLETARSTTRPT